jgi:hypothetical protein
MLNFVWKQKVTKRGMLTEKVTVHGFGGSGFRVHLKPACHPSGRSEPFIHERCHSCFHPPAKPPAKVCTAAGVLYGGQARER